MNKYREYPCGGQRIITRANLPTSVSNKEELNAAVKGFLFCKVRIYHFFFSSPIRSLSLDDV